MIRALTFAAKVMITIFVRFPLDLAIAILTIAAKRIDRILILTILCLAASPAMAEDGPRFGGCFAGGKLCAGPSAAITVGEYSLGTGKFSGGIMPGIGYGLTYQPSKWYATGLALYLAFTVGRGQPNQASPTLLLSFASYVRAGVGAIVQEQVEGPASVSWRILFGFGADFGE